MILEVLLALVTFVVVHHFYNRPKGMPPGPPSFPIIGSGAVVISKDVRKYKKKYGDIFRCELASVKMVYLCNFKLIKEGLSKMELADRPNFKGFHFLTEGREAGVILSNGAMWQNIRRFLLHNLRDLGMGKSFLDQSIIQEAKCLVDDFKNYAGVPTKFPDSLNIAVLNIIWQMVASRRYDLHDEGILELMKNIRVISEDATGFMVLEMFPLLKRLPYFLQNKIFKLDYLNKVIASTKKMFGDAIDDRKEVLDPDYAENVIDEYLIQMDKQTDMAKYFDVPDLIKTVFDLFGAGFDTTSNTLRWVILYAANYPEIQQAVQKQIDEVVSRDDIPTNLHKSQLPLVEAFIHEVLRSSSLIHLGVMHAANTDVSLAGYHIPKDSIVFGATGMCHEDPNYWDDPHEFRIERFLDSEGSFVSHKDGFAPFGIGKRSCLGEALARMELSIFTAALLQNFTFSPPEGCEVDLAPADFPLQNITKPQEILITIRK